MNNKKGISLIALTITIAVMIILATAVFMVSNEMVINSKMAALAVDLEEMEDLVSSYYINNDELPVVATPSWDKDGLVGEISEGASELAEEIELNKDGSDTFFKIDISKLDIENISRGLEAEEDSTDIFVVAKESFNVYYLKGEEIDDTYYFSLSKRLTGESKVPNSVSKDDSDISIEGSTSAIKLSKNTKEWTNNLIVSVSTSVETGETLKYFIAGQDITSSVTGDKINVSEIMLSNATVQTAFYAEGADKTLKVQKFNASGTLIAENSISVSNIDVLSGATISSNSVTYTKYETFTLANISSYTDIGGSGVKEARVLYTKKLSAEGALVSYYNDLPETITSDYVKNVGISTSPKSIKLPTDVKEYVVVFIDNAGNVSEVIKLANMKKITFYIGGVQYSAFEGYTWKDFVESEFNTNGFSIGANGYVSNSDGSMYLFSSSQASNVKETDVIRTSSTNYMFEPL